MCKEHPEERSIPLWYALYTRSHCEQLVCDQLTAKGFHIFLPTLDVWSRRAGQRRRIAVPMFPGYLFLRHAIDKASYIEVRNARGLVRILGDRWDRLSVVPDADIDAIHTTVHAAVPSCPIRTSGKGNACALPKNRYEGSKASWSRASPPRGC